MSQQARTIWAGGGIIASAAIAMLMLLPALLQGDSSPPAAASKFIVHEWGTFTSFSGSDGVNLEFRPLVTNDLPRFVMNPWRQPGHPYAKFDLSKNKFYARQRMETPVTYFYTDVPRTVNVRVDFPTGMLTDWYPIVKNTVTGTDEKSLNIKGHSYLNWGAVQLLPPQQFAEVRVRGPKDKPVPATLPPVKVGDHYGRARETDSAIVETIDVNGASHFEKFLFYRGVGNFQLPLKLAALGNDRFEVTNSGDIASGALLMVQTTQGWVRFTQHPAVPSNASVEIALPEEGSSVEDLAAAMVRELTAAGLYEKEALSMVNTWRDSWFGEDGTRLLYLLPGQWTDDLLPLTIDPAPAEQVRVLVGRLETITPEASERLVRKLTGEPENNKPAQAYVDAELKQLGRFAEPALQFLTGQTKDATTRERLEATLASVRGKRN